MEIGVDDLALEAEPTPRGCSVAAGVTTTKAEARELTDSTEGWPVGLYLAALS